MALCLCAIGLDALSTTVITVVSCEAEATEKTIIRFLFE